VSNDLSHGRDGALVPGQYVPVRVVLGEQPDALLIPQAALMQTQAGDQVLVVGRDDKVESRTVEVGPTYQGQWVVRSGLQKGEQVIVEGLQKAKPGTVVAPKPMGGKKA